MTPKTKINASKGHEIYFFFIVAVLLVLTAIIFTGCAKTGTTGVQGDTGAPGQSISVTTAPASAQECPNGGTDVFIGPQQTTVTTETTNQDQEVVVCNGATGQTGATGSQGPAGTSGTIVTTVQFCPGVTPDYPSTFPESGVCINNVMYGVYSSNGGFLAELPPGEYSSDGINASCTFTVGPDCAVSQ